MFDKKHSPKPSLLPSMQNSQPGASKVPASIEAAVFGEGKSLAKIKAEHDKDTAVMLVSREIKQIGIFYGVEFSYAAVLMAADMIVEEFYYLKTTEIAFAFRQGMLGKYTAFYNKPNPPLLIEWLNAYIEARHTTAATRSQNDHARLKAGTTATTESGNAVFMPDMVRALSERLEADADARLAAVTPPLGFNSIEDAVKHHGIDPTEAKRILEELWDSDWKRVKTEQPDIERTGMTADVFRIYCYNKFLNALNETA